MPMVSLPAAKPALADAVKAFFFENKTRKCMVYGISMAAAMRLSPETR